MTIAQINKRLQKIKNVASDDEHAHSLEDELWHDVLKAIADGCAYPQAMAAAALKSRDIKFSRWCA
jgi:plasmid stability protein